MEFHSLIWEHLQIFICIIYIKREVLRKNAQRKRIPVTFTRMYIDWLCKNNVELDAKFKFKLMKTLWRHENAGIIRFYVRYVIDCKQ